MIGWRKNTMRASAARPRGLKLSALMLCCAASLLMGCATSGTDVAKGLNPDPPGKMFADADGLMQRGKWQDAAKKFEDLDRDHPYAPEARKAIVMASFAYYKAGKYPEAIASARRYTTMHPGTKEAALAHHIVASAHFDEIRDPARDQVSTRKALTELKTLQSRYPDSPYARQAENRIRLAEDILAANEMTVARYYQKQRHHLAAINRYRVVVTDYQTTAHVEEALMRLTENYMALGIRNEAQTAAAVLGHNFPQSAWYRDAHALLQRDGLTPSVSAGSWISQAVKGIIPGKAAPAQQPVPQGLPPPDALPPPVVAPPAAPPRQNVPTAKGATDSRMGLAGQ